MNDTVMTRPRVFIEERFPIDLLNRQVLRETGSTPFNAVHRWFSRKSLSFSRASVLASLLPSDVSAEEFERLLGMPSTVARDFRLYQQTPTHPTIEKVHRLCRDTWGDDFNVLDAFAGGGSIPFESTRYGIPTIAADLNPVAVATMKAAIDVPLKLGKSFSADLNYWIGWVGEQVENKLDQYFPSPTGERARDYLWAHTASCRECGLTVPLAPSWWVDKSASARAAGRACAVRLLVPIDDDNTCTFELVTGRIVDGTINGYNPDSEGTIARATGRCPRCAALLPTDYLMDQGQASQLGFQLYAVAHHTGQGRLSFRAPTSLDEEGVSRARRDMDALLGSYIQDDLVPTEPIPQDTQRGPDLNLYGLYSWQDLYISRQLLSLSTLLSTVRSAIDAYSCSAPHDRTVALSLWLAMVFDRCADMNGRLSNWDASVVATRRASATHSLNLMWNFPEPNGSSRLWQWCAETVTGDYEKLCSFTRGVTTPGLSWPLIPEQLITISANDAANLEAIPDGSITTVVTDPPYYSSIRYAEISDMFYVWQKRVVGPSIPDLYVDDLSNKDLEAIANPGRFRGMPNVADLADRDYEVKLARAFAEYYRVLRRDGVLTVQFNHKESGAWDILSQTLISAGFEITATWSVNTENPNSIHQAEKNAVNSTVLLVCRKRLNSAPAWWEEIQPQVREAVIRRVPELEQMGMKGIDLYLAAFGPALQVLSRNWPVRDRSNQDVRPEVALREARQAVVDERMAQMTGGRYIQVDSVSRFYLVAWDCFLAREFSFDEGRLLALATGDVDVSALRDRYRLLTKKGSDISFLLPRERVRSGAVNLRADSYATMVDALHAALALYTDDGITAVQRFFERTNLFANPDFVQFVELALKMLPPATEEHKALTDLLLSDVKLRGAIQIPLFEDVEAQMHEQPRLL